MNLAFEHLEHPLALMFAVPAVLWAFVLVLAARAPLSRWGRWLLGAARASLLVALLFLIAEPSRRVEGPIPGRLEVLLDRSRSLGPAQRSELAAEADRRIRRAMTSDPEQALQVVAFAGAAISLYEGKAGEFDIDHWRDRLDALDSDAALEPMSSRLRPALASLRSGREDSRDTVCLVFTDGALESPPAAMGPQSARHYLLTPSTIVDGSRRLLGLELPERLDDETALTFRLSYEAGEPMRAPLEVLIDGQVVLATEVDLEAGTGQWNFGGEGIVLPTGLHRVLVRGVLGDDEPLDDRIGGAVEVHARRRPVYVEGSDSPGRDPALFRALEAQGIDLNRVTPASLALALSEPERVSAVILDRVAPSELDPEVSGTLIALVEAGRGLVVFPGRGEGELVAWNEHPLATLLPLAGLPPPPPAPEDEAPPPEVKDPPKKLDDPDPDRARKEVVDAPT
ncbi:MAG: hypothetical protein KDB53_16510, partial [Planctomycetes bacterium]|nr:hypothetical protein [Planctomycetota bacterium]